MLRLVTKEEFWAAIDAGAYRASMSSIRAWPAMLASRFSMKQVQDAVLLHRLQDAFDLDILEVGGGRSRTLPVLCRHNRCVNADPVEGMGHGPVGAGVRFARGSMCSAPWATPPGFFRTTPLTWCIPYPVLEHVPAPARLRRHDPRAAPRRAHAAPCRRLSARFRRRQFLAAPRRVRVSSGSEGRSVATHMEDGDLYFRCTYATNPDLAMYAWNKFAPGMTATRKVAQGCSFLFEAERA